MLTSTFSKVDTQSTTFFPIYKPQRREKPIHQTATKSIIDTYLYLYYIHTSTTKKTLCEPPYSFLSVSRNQGTTLLKSARVAP